MDKETIKKEYAEYAVYYEQLQKEIFGLLNLIVDNRKYKNIDIAEIKERPKGKIKSLESIFENIDRSDKYADINHIFDIKDIAGVRVTCHCEDDLYAFSEIIENKFNDDQYFDVRRDDMGGKEQKSSKQKNRPSYSAVHITLSKKYKHKNKIIMIHCEVQLRTVMGDAWAVQDRKYRYGQDIAEGDRNILTDSVFGILNGCEGLWSLVKKKYRDGLNGNGQEFKAVNNPAPAETIILKPLDAKAFDSDLEKDNL